MTDRELLELAARAAGYSLDSDLDRVDIRQPSGAPMPWNPLTDDGDAFRLAVEMNMEIIRGKYPSGVRYVSCHREWSSRDSMYYYVGTSANDGNELAATRRAIVRAAAEIGRSMQ